MAAPRSRDEASAAPGSRGEGERRAVSVSIFHYVSGPGGSTSMCSAAHRTLCLLWSTYSLGWFSVPASLRDAVSPTRAGPVPTLCPPYPQELVYSRCLTMILNDTNFFSFPLPCLLSSSFFLSPDFLSSFLVLRPGEKSHGILQIVQSWVKVLGAHLQNNEDSPAPVQLAADFIMIELKFRSVKLLAQGHTANKR